MRKNNDKTVKFYWPMAKYDVIIPKNIEKDIFVWLYLNLVIFENNIRKKPKNAKKIKITDEVILTIVKNFVDASLK